MFAIKATVDTSRLDDTLRKFERRVTLANAIALTRVAQSAKSRIEQDMPRVFDRPTPWTLRSLRVQPATRDKMWSAVLVKDKNAGDVAGEKSHLWPQIKGGPRHSKAFEARLRRQAWLRQDEYLAPSSSAPLDAYGNVPASVIRTILSQLGAANAPGNAGYDSNVKRGQAQSRQSKRRQAKAGTYFMPRRGYGLPPGIYRRVRSGNRWVTNMIFAVVRRPSYKSRLPFQATVADVVEKELQRHFDAELAKLTNG